MAFTGKQQNSVLTDDGGKGNAHYDIAYSAFNKGSAKNAKKPVFCKLGAYNSCHHPTLTNKSDDLPIPPLTSKTFQERIGLKIHVSK